MDRYFYLNSNNEQSGPVSPADFNRYGITETTMIWKQGMPNWMRAGQIPELSQYFRPTPPQPAGGNNYGGNSYGNGGSVNIGANNFSGNYGGGNQYRPAKPDNNMIWAVLSTLFCCLPAGVYSIIQASKVNGLYNSGQYNEAQQMADDAKKWAIISAVLGLIAFVIAFIAGLAGA
ncbi:MAG: CD225/dispanin family protein [Bacteroidaceae bacterium]|nr:CD225/dispanin family protein [Bacteroidaceae bacterium]